MTARVSDLTDDDLDRWRADLAERSARGEYVYCVNLYACLCHKEDVKLREYAGNEIAEFLRADEMDEEARGISKRFAKVPDGGSARLSRPA